MRRAFPESCVTGGETLIGSLELPDPDDRHVLATAIRAGAEHIVTENLRDFPDSALEPFGITAITADDFLASTFERYRVNHNKGEYVSYGTGCHVQTLEGFWSQLKRAINGTHIHVSSKHLWNYAKEAEYRFNRRDASETMFAELVSSFLPLSALHD